LRLEAVRKAAGGRAPDRVAGLAMESGAVRRALAEARHWRARLGVAEEEGASDSAGLLLALAYPDRVARRRPGAVGRFLLRNGRGARVEEGALAAAEFLVAAEVDGAGPDGRVFLGAPVEWAELEPHLAGRVEREETLAWDAAARAVRGSRTERLGAIVLRRAPLRRTDPQRVKVVLMQAIASEGLAALPWTPGVERLRQRLAFLHALDASWPPADEDALLRELDAWLGPWLEGVASPAEISARTLAEGLLARLPRERRSVVDALAPERMEVPSGSWIDIEYADPEAPVLAVRLQEVFGWTETPRVGGGRVPLTLHLLSPALRPVQVTRDLASFWRTGYFDVRKDLRGRYPKHHWPEDPLGAAPVRGARRRT
jgi:ATP-dependent helicase HrpB